MMGTRERTPSGDEYDAFSRRARRITHWRPGEVHLLKARFWRRVRRLARLAAAKETRR